MKSYHSKKEVITGASVRGLGHKQSHLPNQDYFLIKKQGLSTVLVVCDGVGSEKYAKNGAKKASYAVLKVMKLYEDKKISFKEIGKEIEKYYLKALPKYQRQEAATTCLFAYIGPSKETIIGEAGDGAIYLYKDGKSLKFQKKTDDFMNEVQTLSGKYSFNGWKIKKVNFNPLVNKDFGILLTTDGISEDILPDKEEEFLNYFFKINEEGPKALLDELRNWDVPGSNDDKTVVIYHWR